DELASDRYSLTILFAIDVKAEIVGLAARLPGQQDLAVVVSGSFGVDYFGECWTEIRFPHSAPVCRDAKKLAGGVFLGDSQVEDRYDRQSGAERRPGSSGVRGPIDTDVGSSKKCG